jgi:predicted esterase
MKKLLLGFTFLVTCIITTAQQVARSLTTPSNLFIGFYEFKPPTYNANPTKNYPLIIFLHGVGERGNGTSELGRVLANGVPKNINNGSTMTFTVNGVTESFLVLSPQLSTAFGGWKNDYVDAMINYAKQNLRVDADRIFLTGLSLGGGGTWEYVTSDAANAAKLAGIAPVCPSGYFESGLCYVKNANLPVWGFHAVDDPTCGVGITMRAIEGVNNCNPAVAPIVSYYANGGHGIWGRAYDESHTYHSPLNMYEWFLTLGRGAYNTPNIAPVANAGSNINITLPANTNTLNGAASIDADGPIAMYRWKKIAGPANYTIVDTTAKTTTLKDLVAGNYQFQLTVTDYRGATGVSIVNVTVSPGVGPNIPPVANAGNDFSTSQNSLWLSAGSSYDPDGYLIGYDWKQVQGPTTVNWVGATSLFPTISNMSGGIYKFEVTVFDNMGAATQNVVTVTNTLQVLPVEYAYVKGKRVNNKNIISWATANEQNSDYFDVERSDDGITYTVIGKLKAAGNSTTLKEYSFTDEKSPAVKTLYRLKQVDKDYKFKLSKNIYLAPNDQKGNTIAFYPNPVQQALTVVLNNDDRGKGNITLYSIEGRVLHQESFTKEPGNFNTSINMDKIQSGVYLVEVKVGSHYKTVQRIVKQ